MASPLIYPRSNYAVENDALRASLARAFHRGRYAAMMKWGTVHDYEDFAPRVL